MYHKDRFKDKGFQYGGRMVDYNTQLAHACATLLKSRKEFIEAERAKGNTVEEFDDEIVVTTREA